MIRLSGLSKSYHEGDAEHVVLRDVNATIAQGEYVAVLGPSGSGKSTLLNLMSGIDQPTAGEVVIGDAAITRMSERERTLFRRRHLGFVFQFFNLIPTLTVAENLLLPLELNGRNGRDADAAVRGLLERVGLAERAGSYPDRLSGGEQQRVAIARALVHEPMVVLADEPTGNLDAETGKDVLDLLDALTRGAGRTLVVVTHSAGVVKRADRVLRVQDGRLVEI